MVDAAIDMVRNRRPDPCWLVHLQNQKEISGSRIAALKDWLGYIAISVALVIVIVIYADYGPKRSPIGAKWIAFAINTAFVFGCTLKIVRPLWRKPKLWAALTALVVLHGTIGCLVICRVERIPLIWYVPVDIAEIWAALIATQLVCGELLPPTHKP